MCLCTTAPTSSNIYGKAFFLSKNAPTFCQRRIRCKKYSMERSFFFQKKCHLFPNTPRCWSFFFSFRKLCCHGEKKTNWNQNVVFSQLSLLHHALGQPLLKNFLNLCEQSQKAAPIPCRLLGSNYLVDYLFMIKGFWLMFRDVIVLPTRGPVN